MTRLKKIFSVFTRKERITFIISAVVAVASFIVVVSISFVSATVAVPAAGGEYSEGVIGQPEYVNPVIAVSETDNDLVKMVYSNLYDIADSVTSSANMRTWTVRLKEGLTWQDGQKLTSDDVIFTVQSIQNPDARSPLAQSWQGVAVSRVSELELQFSLINSYAFFADNLKNLYILPKHLFVETPPGNWRISDYNLKPVGSGPYKFLSYGKGTDGFISSYNLEAWDGYAGTKPLIKNFDFAFYNDENTLVGSFNSGKVDGFGNVSPEDLATIQRPYDLFAWRTSSYYAVFFNQSKNLALQDTAVRKALSLAIDRSALVDQTVKYGTPEYGPIPQDAAYFSASTTPASGATSSTTSTSNASDPGAILDAAGWKVGSNGFRAKTISKSSIPLTINLTVPQIDFLAKTADAIRNTWQAIGVQVNVTLDSPSNIISQTVKNRSYEALLFGNVLGPSSDLYSFWNSSQEFYPGLNLAIYNNKKVDALIQSARANTNDTSRMTQFAQAQAAIIADYPAVFLYSPDYVYVTNKNAQGISTDLLPDPSDRFREVGAWYLNTARVLK